MSILWDNGAREGFFRVFHFHKICLSGRIKDFDGEGAAKTGRKRAGAGESRCQRLQAGSLLSRRLNGFRQVGCAVSLRYRERIRAEGFMTGLRRYR